MRIKQSYRLSADVTGQLDDYAARKRIPKAIVVETALLTFFSPDGADRLEAALSRRLDRFGRQIERLERHAAITNETLALFVRFWLTHTPPMPDTAEAAALAKGNERYDGFVEALGRRLARGTTFADEVATEVAHLHRQEDLDKTPD
jgi:hypothetical protein